MSFMGRLTGITLAALMMVAVHTHADEAARTVIVFGSCNDQNEPQNFWQPLLDEQPDLALFLGDNVYGDVSSGEMRELRVAYDTLGREPGFQALRDSTTMLAVWDDHDYGRNDAGGDFPWRGEAEELFLDFWQVPSDDPRRGRSGIYTAQTFGEPGQQIQVILLDLRSFRDSLLPTDESNAPGKERYLPDRDPGKTMLGEEQWAWLAGVLREPADLRLVVSSIQVLADGHGWERWGNLPAERTRLLSLLSETEANRVVLLSGDRHVGGIYLRDDVLDYPLIEVTSSSFNRPWRGAREAGPNRLGGLVDQENFGRISVDWTAGTLDLAIVGLDGGTIRSLSLPLTDLQAQS